MFNKALAAAAAASLAISPAVAQTAYPEQTSGYSESSGNPLTAPGSPIAPILFAGVIAFGVLLATGTWPFDDDEDEAPISP